MKKTLKIAVSVIIVIFLTITITYAATNDNTACILSASNVRQWWGQTIKYVNGKIDISIIWI